MTSQKNNETTASNYETLNQIKIGLRETGLISISKKSSFNIVVCEFYISPLRFFQPSTSGNQAGSATKCGMTKITNTFLFLKALVS